MDKKIGNKFCKLFICFMMLLVSFVFYEDRAEAFSNQVIQQGAVGDDVIELQSRLQYLGFYNGKIDGVFGWRSYWALRNFQYEFGLPIDGLAGSKTKEKLVDASKYNESYVKDQINKGNKFTHYGGVDLDKQTQNPTNKNAGKSANTNQGKTNNKAADTNNKAGKTTGQQKNTSEGKTNQQQKATEQPKTAQQNKTKTKTKEKKPTAANVPNGFSQNDLQLMANAVYGESRGEPYTGQVAVAAVILNRINSASFPNTVSGVIFEPGAFTAVADGQIYLTPNEKAKEAVLDAINGWDPTGNALYYFNPDTATSAWIWTRPQIKKIGKHIFCK